MRYAYAGPGPHEDPELGLVHPGDEHEFEAEPAWGPWRPVIATGGEPGDTSPPVNLSAVATAAADSPPPADPEPPAADSGGM